MWIAILLNKKKREMLFLLLCLKTLLGITAKATCFLCSRDLFAWANPQRQFKLEPFFLSLRVKAPPWQRGAHSPELSSQQLCRGKLVKASALSCKRSLTPCIVCRALCLLTAHLFQPTGTWVVVFNSVLSFTLPEPLLSLWSWHPPRGKWRSGWL